MFLLKMTLTLSNTWRYVWEKKGKKGLRNSQRFVHSDESYTKTNEYPLTKTGSEFGKMGGKKRHVHQL